MTITTFTIDSNAYSSYATVAEADSFLRIDLTRYGVWSALSDTDKEIRLAFASRRIDEAGVYSGTREVANQPLEFPRDNLMRDGEPFSDKLPQDIVDACLLLAGSPQIARSTTSTSPGTQRLVSGFRAGPVEIDFEPSASGAPLPTTDAPPLFVPDEAANALITPFFAESRGVGIPSGGTVGSRAFGTTRGSSFSNDDEFGIGY